MSNSLGLADFAVILVYLVTGFLAHCASEVSQEDVLINWITLTSTTGGQISVLSHFKLNSHASNFQTSTS